MKKPVLILATAAILFSAISCQKVIGEGPVQTETRSVSNFSGVSASISGKIYYKLDPDFKVEITAQSNILNVIETSRSNGHLLIKVKNGVRIRTDEDIIVHVSAPSADYFHLSGSGDLFVAGNLNTTGLDMDISGSGNITVASAAVTEKLKAVISGSGNIKVMSGSATNEDLRISGSGKILLEGVSAEDGKTTISGSGDIKTKLSKSLDATISGSGSVYYLGNPLISTHISGSGRVRPL